jgi:hypothetical protein
LAFGSAFASALGASAGGFCGEGDVRRGGGVLG